MFLDAAPSWILRRATRSLGDAASLLACILLPAIGRGQVPGELRGRVTDGATGRPIPDARIELADRADGVRSASDGSFVVHGLEPQAYLVSVRAVGYAPFRRDVEIDNGRTATLDAILERLPAHLARVVTTASRGTTEPGSITIDRAAIESSGRRDVGELLSAVPGVVITQSGGPGQPTQASIRGSTAAEVLVVVDGTVVNSPLTGIADLSQLSLATTERVIVLEGAQSARFGGRALAGAIVVETRRADREATIGAGAGSWGEREAGASLGDAAATRGGRTSGLLSVERRTSQGDFPYDVPAVRGGGTARRTNSDASSTNMLGVGVVDGRLGTLRARADWRSSARGLAGSIVQPSVTGRDNEHHASGALDVESAPGVLSFNGSASVARDRSHFSDPTPPFGSTYDDLVNATESRAAAAGHAAGTHADATLGAEARRLEVASTSLAPGSPTSQTLAGAYAHLKTQRQWSDVGVAASVSGRVDHDDLLTGVVASPRASLEVTRGAASLSGSIGNAYSPPSLADQFFHEGVLVRANPSLAPERTRGETELRGAIRDVSVGFAQLSADAAAFRADVHGMILWSPDFRFIWSPANADVRREGWQLSGRAAVPALVGLMITGGIDRADVTYTGAVQSGQVVYRPRTTARVAESVARSFARLDVETRYVGSRRTVAGSELNSLSPYWLTDVRVAAPVVRDAWRLDAMLGVENVFDRAASMLVDFPFGGRRWTIGLRASRRRAFEPGD
jgi:outer membrane cobalamin receptor